MPAVLVLNAGSSSIKFALFPVGEGASPGPATLSGQIDGLGVRAHMKARDAAGAVLEDRDLDLAGGLDAQHREALARLLDWLASHSNGDRVVAAGHRVVHGGERFDAPAVVTPELLDVLKTFEPLAPLHQPYNLGAIRAVMAVDPAIVQVACFDTAFHRGQPRLAQLFALPRDLTAEGVRRYGFHGLSYESIAGQLPTAAPDVAKGRVVVAHLGNGASMCAMKAGRSVASTMGFTAVDGLMMGTRTGALDPGVLLYLMQSKGWDAKRLERLLYRESGLLGVSGLSADMRQLLAAGTPEAEEAIDLFCYRAAREVGGLAATLEGLDALVFTGGIGEKAAPVRERIARRCAWLGLDLDVAANAAGAAVISTPSSRVKALVLHTDEESMIARHTARLAIR